MKETLSIWHQFVVTQDPSLLEEILGDDVVFHSPFVWAPKPGKTIVTQILVAATNVFNEFEYVREVVNETDAVLEFSAGVGDLKLRGVDMIRIDEEGKIVDFEVMVRPANALMALGQAMTKELGLPTS